MTPSIDTVLDRVRKMHAKAESARELGSLHEAETFATAVQRMLEAHKLSMGDIEIAEQDALDPMGAAFVDYEGWGLQAGKRREKWAVALAGAVARAHFCRTVSWVGQNRIQFIGRKSDMEVAQYVFLTLYRLGVNLSKRDYAALGRTDKGWRPAWLAGFATAIAERYRQMASGRAGMMALVRADREATEHMNKLHSRLSHKQLGLGAQSASGAQAGRAAGHAANLTPARGVEQAPRSRQLTGGR